MKLEMIKIGRIVNAHGIRGEVRVQPRDADPFFLTQFKTFYLDGKAVKPTACHVHKSLVLMKLPGVDDMNTALTLKDKVLYIRREDAKLPEGSFFLADIEGLEVRDAQSGAVLGKVHEVLTLPANNVYVIKGGEREIMVPAVPQFIAETNIEEGFVRVNMMEGL